MNNIVDNFGQILEFAKNYGIPLSKKRAILREYLQIRILDLVYQEKLSINLYFVGGTSLRLLRGIDRFSEDLDFDTRESYSKIDKLIEKVYQKLLNENIEINLYRNITARRAYFEFRFNELLYQLKIADDKSEKLTIKFDFERFWKFQKRDVVLLNKYGFLINVVTVCQEQVLVQKLFAYLSRKQTLPRDIYDIIWLSSRGVKLDLEFIEKNKLPVDLVRKATEKFLKEKTSLRMLKIKLKPFLINENYAEKLDLFPSIVGNLELK